MLSTLKVVFGPLGGYAAQLNIIVTMIVTFAGMMTSVLLITFFGDLLKKGRLKNWFERQQVRAMNSKWRKYGLLGIAILTPLLLTPIGGSVIAVAGGYQRSKIIFYMFISAVVYAVGFTFLVYYLGDELIVWLKSVGIMN